MSLTSGMAKLNLDILICFISETIPNRFLDAANICTNRLQLVLRHNESYTVSINSSNSSNCNIAIILYYNSRGIYFDGVTSGLTCCNVEVSYYRAGAMVHGCYLRSIRRTDGTRIEVR